MRPFRLSAACPALACALLTAQANAGIISALSEFVWEEDEDYLGLVSSSVDNHDGVGAWAINQTLSAGDSDSRPIAAVSTYNETYGVCTREAVESGSSDCNYSGNFGIRINPTTGEEEIYWAVDLGELIVEAETAFWYTFNIESEVDALAPVSIDWLLDVLIATATFGDAGGSNGQSFIQLLAEGYADIVVARSSGALIPDSNGIIDPFVGPSEVSDHLSFAVAGITEPGGIRATRSGIQTRDLLTNTDYAVFLRAGAFSYGVPGKLGDSLELSIGALADPIFTIDPEWEFAGVSSIRYGLPTEAFSYSAEGIFGLSEPASVPEPPTLMLMAGALLVAGAARRHRSATARRGPSGAAL